MSDVCFEQFARGTVSLNVKGPYHCGPDNTSPKIFNIEVRIEWPKGCLDSNGFLLDNLFFDEYFKGHNETELSCELLADKCAWDLAALTQWRALNVCVTVWAITDRVCITRKLSRNEFEEKGKDVYA